MKRYSRVYASVNLGCGGCEYGGNAPAFKERYEHVCGN